MPGFGIRNSIAFSNGHSHFDPNAQAYFTAIGDLPGNYQTVVNSLVVDLKTYSLWTKLKFGILPAITLDDTDTVIDIVTATKLSGAKLTGTTDTGFRDSMATPLPIGFYFLSNDYIKTGAIPTSIHTNNSICIAHGILQNESGGSKFYYSAQQTTSALITGSLRTAGNSAIIDSYTTTGNAGRNTFGGVTDVSGRWIHNRRSATDVELYKSGSSIGSAANGGGTQPNIEMYLGAQNSAGTPGAYANHFCTYHLEFSGLTATERNNLETVMSAYETNLGNLRTLTRNLIMDGNSLSIYDNWGTLRKASYYAYATGKKLYRTRDYGVAGQTTAAMLADYAAQVAPQYSGSYTKNIYVIDEVRNDLYFGAAAADVKTTLTGLVAAAKATGFTVAIMNLRFGTYVGNTGRTETQWNLVMDELATYITANSFGADYIIEVNDSNMWSARSNFASDAAYNTYVAAAIINATYFTDGTHGTPEYHRILGYNLATQSLNLIG
jgi:hypothetical protein